MGFIGGSNRFDDAIKLPNLVLTLLLLHPYHAGSSVNHRESVTVYGTPILSVENDWHYPLLNSTWPGLFCTQQIINTGCAAKKLHLMPLSLRIRVEAKACFKCLHDKRVFAPEGYCTPDQAESVCRKSHETQLTAIDTALATSISNSIQAVHVPMNEKAICDALRTSYQEAVCSQLCDLKGNTRAGAVCDYIKDGIAGKPHFKQAQEACMMLRKHNLLMLTCTSEHEGSLVISVVDDSWLGQNPDSLISCLTCETKDVIAPDGGTSVATLTQCEVECCSAITQGFGGVPVCNDICLMGGRPCDLLHMIQIGHIPQYYDPSLHRHVWDYASYTCACFMHCPTKTVTCLEDGTSASLVLALEDESKHKIQWLEGNSSVIDPNMLQSQPWKHTHKAPAPSATASADSQGETVHKRQYDDDDGDGDRGDGGDGEGALAAAPATPDAPLEDPPSSALWLSVPSGLCSHSMDSLCGDRTHSQGCFTCAHIHRHSNAPINTKSCRLLDIENYCKRISPCYGPLNHMISTGWQCMEVAYLAREEFALKNCLLPDIRAACAPPGTVGYVTPPGYIQSQFFCNKWCRHPCSVLHGDFWKGCGLCSPSPQGCNPATFPQVPERNSHKTNGGSLWNQKTKPACAARLNLAKGRLKFGDLDTAKDRLLYSMKRDPSRNDDQWTCIAYMLKAKQMLLNSACTLFDAMSFCESEEQNAEKKARFIKKNTTAKFEEIWNIKKKEAAVQYSITSKPPTPAPTHPQVVPTCKNILASNPWAISGVYHVSIQDHVTGRVEKMAIRCHFSNHQNRSRSKGASITYVSNVTAGGVQKPITLQSLKNGDIKHKYEEIWKKQASKYHLKVHKFHRIAEQNPLERMKYHEEPLRGFWAAHAKELADDQKAIADAKSAKQAKQQQKTIKAEVRAMMAQKKKDDVKKHKTATKRTKAILDKLLSSEGWT